MMLRDDLGLNITVLWLLFGFGIVYLSKSIGFASLFFLVGIITLLSWIKREKYKSSKSLKRGTLMVKGVFLVFMIILTFFQSELLRVFPPGNAMLSIMRIVLYVAIGILSVSFLGEFLNKRNK